MRAGGCADGPKAHIVAIEGKRVGDKGERQRRDPFGLALLRGPVAHDCLGEAMNADGGLVAFIFDFEQRDLVKGSNRFAARDFAHDIRADQAERNVVRREISEDAHERFGLGAVRGRVLDGEAEGGIDASRLVRAFGSALDEFGQQLSIFVEARARAPAIGRRVIEGERQMTEIVSEAGRAFRIRALCPVEQELAGLSVRAEPPRSASRSDAASCSADRGRWR